MTTSSHLAGSALIYLAASALAETAPSVEGLAASAFGSLLPDIDAPTSSIGRPFFPLASWINRRIGHRTLTHSFLGLAGFAAVLAGLDFLLRFLGLGEGLSGYLWPLVLGYGSHLLVDSLNKTGVELFWPSGLRCVFFLNVSRTAPLQIYPTRVAIVLGEPQEISVVRVDMAGKTLGEIPRFPEARRVLIHGFVTPVRLPRVSVREDRLDTVSIRFDKLRLGYAEYGDLRGMESLLIREGVLTLAVYRSSGSPAAVEVDLPESGERVEHVSLRFAPGDEVFLKEGDRVEFGQVIGRKDTRLAVVRLERDCRRDLEALGRRLEDNRLRLADAAEALSAAQMEVEELERNLASVSGEPLLERERLAREKALEQDLRHV